MKDYLMAIGRVRQDGVKGTLIVDKQLKQTFFTPQIVPESKAHRWLLWLLIISGVLVTPWWLLKYVMTVPHVILRNPWAWWLVLFLTAGLPIIAWLVGRQREHYQRQYLQPVTLEAKELRRQLHYWPFERAWIWFVLTLLPPTSLMFLGFYIVKADIVDALLITVHATLFMRRLIPHAFSRIMISTKKLVDWRVRP
ncbi:hypothetical protein OZX65_04515 [Leuconostocaceae bacterium ESL0723]|nr:hypothetical protein OZX65_04515 [Leuconostocaceae bacterium ESL0723]